MSPVSVILRVILLVSVVCANSVEPGEQLACKFITCKSCTGGRLGNCVWQIYYSGAQKCNLKMGHDDGVEAEADEPFKCAKPDCVMPKHNAWDLEGIAQLIGGLFGGFLGGYLGVLGFRRVRQGRGNQVGYQQIGGEESWRDALRAFFVAFIERIRRRRNVVQVQAEDDPTHERQLRAAIQRQRQEQQQQQVQENNPIMNQPGMGMQFDMQGGLADDANAISPDRPGIADGAADIAAHNVTIGGNNQDLDSDDLDDGEAD